MIANPSIPAPRKPASPYARSLARRRGIALDGIKGSGPDGRITGADVPPAAPPATAATPTGCIAPESPARATAAIGASVDLAQAGDLIRHLAELAPEIELTDLLLKATAQARRAVPGLADATVVLTRADTNTPRILAGLDRAMLRGIAAMRSSPAGPEAAPAAEAALAVTMIARPGLRPVAMPLAPETIARLVVAATQDAETAECLLCYDPLAIPDAAAADFLAAFRRLVEDPRRLIT
jgi:pyruvate dehydrogenase E2 component (dihydrolipoamide acetyltransferase)